MCSIFTRAVAALLVESKRILGLKMAKKKTTTTKKAASKTTKKAPASAKKKLDKMNETGKRKDDDRRSNEEVKLEGSERRKTKRRRQIDPTTCEREYNNAEIEFMHALDEYKRASGRMFPTCSEILEVIVGLGYRQVAEAADGFAFEKENDSTADAGDEFDEETLEKELEDQLI